MKNRAVKKGSTSIPHFQTSPFPPFLFGLNATHTLMKYRIYSNTICILIKPAPPIEPAVVLSKFPIKPAANLCCLEIEPADCNRINTVIRKTNRRIIQSM